ncbi:MAG TPA: transposase [Tepidisphaeraceae bacterium]|nr:transposase [Tepidisphaeraceae bacterium]
MARKRRSCPGGLAYHVMNRATARKRIFDDAADYLAFERVLAEARKRSDGQMRICSYVLMPNHFHLVLWPETDGALSKFMQWLTLTHAQRWHAHRHSAGTGALYGARFKSFPVRDCTSGAAPARTSPAERNCWTSGPCPGPAVGYDG